MAFKLVCQDCPIKQRGWLLTPPSLVPFVKLKGSCPGKNGREKLSQGPGGNGAVQSRVERTPLC